MKIEGAPPRTSPISVRLANAVGRASLGRRLRAVDLATVAPFGWDRVYVFRNASSTEIQQRLGFGWPGAPPSVPRSEEHESLLAFVDGKHVTQSAFFSDAIGHLDCLAARGGYQRGTSFVIRFTPKGREPYLTTVKPDAAEAVCLRAVGISP